MKKLLKPFAVAICLCMLLTACVTTPAEESSQQSSAEPSTAPQILDDKGLNMIESYDWVQSPLSLDLNTDKSLNNQQLGNISFYLDDNEMFLTDTQEQEKYSFVRIDQKVQSSEGAEYAISFLCTEPATTIYGLVAESVGTETELYALSASPLLDFLKAFPAENIQQYYRGQLNDEIYYSGASYYNNNGTPCTMVLFLYGGHEYSIQFVGFSTNNADNIKNYEALISSFDFK